MKLLYYIKKLNIIFNKLLVILSIMFIYSYYDINYIFIDTDIYFYLHIY